MFKHILLPTDGSKQSEAAIIKGIQLAKSINAKVTGFHVIEPYHSLTIRTEILVDAEGQYERYARLHAEQYLSVIEREAKAAGVTCETACVVASHVYEAIIEAAEVRGCDVIVMASHGSKGVQGLLIGSETAKVLTHTKLPVLVFH